MIVPLPAQQKRAPVSVSEMIIPALAPELRSPIGEKMVELERTPPVPLVQTHHTEWKEPEVTQAQSVERAVLEPRAVPEPRYMDQGFITQVPRVLNEEAVLEATGKGPQVIAPTALSPFYSKDTVCDNKSQDAAYGGRRTPLALDRIVPGGSDLAADLVKGGCKRPIVDGVRGTLDTDCSARSSTAAGAVCKQNVHDGRPNVDGSSGGNFLLPTDRTRKGDSAGPAANSANADKQLGDPIVSQYSRNSPKDERRLVTII